MRTPPDVLPVFTSKSNTSPWSGGDITFHLPGRASGAHVVMFKHIHPDGEHRLLFVGGMALKQTLKLTKDGNSFKLNGVRRSHAGSYVCRIETSPAIEVTHTLDVQYPAKVRRVSQEVQQVIQGSSVSLECRADGNPPAAISWSRQHGHLPSGAQSEEAILHTGEGDEAKTGVYRAWQTNPHSHLDARGSRHQHRQTHLLPRRLHHHALTVKHMKDDDFGDYTCTATSPLGRTNSSLRLTGEGCPKTPRLTSSPAGGEKTSFTLTWEAESYTPVIMYPL
ncbi:Basement membrane-specific heparan sulfate proteoglycan core protein [Chionoecetes opilio]|uniref:Basement membrane-specific heparan sulfate proteoglycan core protein n=1 Tax=Chionoecetes opilio TaxID=41210 RepID=A0A8J8WER3_CHIOP|nr:Basement membrane-specific heparan sulfate proteoglycan core protein [Chionoecetes opilio]